MELLPGGGGLTSCPIEEYGSYEKLPRLIVQLLLHQAIGRCGWSKVREVQVSWTLLHLLFCWQWLAGVFGLEVGTGDCAFSFSPPLRPLCNLLLLDWYLTSSTADSHETIIAVVLQYKSN